MTPLNKNPRAIVGLAIASIGTVCIALAAASPIAQAVVALPAACGLLAALWELVKASIDHRHRLDEQTAANSFALSATSFMAERAFEKHLEFAERYYGATREALSTLFKDGPAESSLDVARVMAGIRHEYALWEPKEMGEKLGKIEQAMRNVGADSYRLNHEPVGPQRTAIVDKMYHEFSKLMGLQELSGPNRADTAISNVLDHFRELLGISSLTALRRHYLDQALKQMPPRT